MTPTEGQTTTEAADEPAVGCGYSGYEFGASYPDSYCRDGFLHDADSDYLADEVIPCPMCEREAAIQWWFGRWEGMGEAGDERPQEQIDADHLANATSLVDDIRFNRGIPLPATGAKTP